MKTLFFAKIQDRLQNLEGRKTKYYNTYLEAYEAGWKLANKYYPTGRGIVTVDVNYKWEGK